MAYYSGYDFFEAATSAPTASPSSSTASRGATSSAARPPASGATTRPPVAGGPGTSRPSSPRPSPSPRPGPSPGSQPSGRERGFNFERLLPYVRQGWEFFRPIVQQQLTRVIAPQPAPGPGYAPAPVPAGPADQPTAPDQPSAPQPVAYDTGPAPAPAPAAPDGQPPASADQLAAMMQAMRDRQIPSLPMTIQPPPAGAPPLAPAAAGAPQPDAMALLRLILSNPQLLQALQPAAPRAVTLPVPAMAPPHRMRPVSVPLGAVINLISALSGQAMSELNASTPEDAPAVPEYLVDEDGDFLVDPTSPDDRAKLVAHLFGVSDHAQRLANSWQLDGPMSDLGDELDESELWARDAGFTRRAW